MMVNQRPILDLVSLHESGIVESNAPAEGYEPAIQPIPLVESKAPLEGEAIRRLRQPRNSALVPSSSWSHSPYPNDLLSYRISAEYFAREVAVKNVIAKQTPGRSSSTLNTRTSPH